MFPIASEEKSTHLKKCEILKKKPLMEFRHFRHTPFLCLVSFSLFMFCKFSLLSHAKDVYSNSGRLSDTKDQYRSVIQLPLKSIL